MVQWYLPNIVDPSRFHDLSDGTLPDIGNPDVLSEESLQAREI
jgi:hypothetical protein